MTRHRHTQRELVALFHGKGGICHICKQPIQVCDKWDVSHPIPLELGGADDASNWDIAHRKCHRDLTATVDHPTIAKVKRQAAAHIGAKPAPKAKIPQRAKEPRPKRDTLPLPPRRDIFSREIVK